MNYKKSLINSRKRILEFARYGSYPTLLPQIHVIMNYKKSLINSRKRYKPHKVGISIRRDANENKKYIY